MPPETTPPSSKSATPNVSVAWSLRRSWRAEPLLRRAARHALVAEGFLHGALSIAVVGRRAMSTLHERFSGVNGPTDVLTFDLGCDRSTNTVDAEIVICADVALRRGGSQSAARRELALYAVHGILHLAGFDDHTDQGFADMHAREDALLVELGLGRVFANAPRDSDEGPSRRADG